MSIIRQVLPVALMGGLLAGCAQAPGEEVDPSPASGPSSAEVEPSPVEVEPSPAAQDIGPADDSSAAEPAGLQIPSIDLDEDQMVDLEIMEDGRLEEPSSWDDIGWFSEGNMPGQDGPTVIAGHVDSSSGPAIFYRVLEMEPGDSVTVVDAEGESHEYRVERTADYPKDDFPTRDVFGAAPEDELRLITCTGYFDHAEQRHLDNRVVFASKVV